MVAYPSIDLVLDQYNAIEDAKTDKSQESAGKFFENVISQKTGNGKFTLEGREFYGSYTPIEDTNWIFIVSADAKEIFAATSRLQIIAIIMISIILVISTIAVYFMGGSIAGPIIGTVKYAEGIANLDITQDVPHKIINRKDEIGLLAQSFQKITDNLRDTLYQVGNY